MQTFILFWSAKSTFMTALPNGPHYEVVTISNACFHRNWSGVFGEVFHCLITFLHVYTWNFYDWNIIMLIVSIGIPNQLTVLQWLEFWHVIIIIFCLFKQNWNIVNVLLNFFISFFKIPLYFSLMASLA